MEAVERLEKEEVVKWLEIEEVEVLEMEEEGVLE